MKLTLYSYIFLLILMIVLLPFTGLNTNITNRSVIDEEYKFNLNTKYLWPVIGCYKITSQFGYRNQPTKGSSSNHGGVDIAAPQGAKLIAIMDGYVKFIGFLGAGGYTIIIQHLNNVETIYCHVDNKNFPILNVKVKKGDVIGRVGPKNVYDYKNNSYFDSKGNPTNGATTGPHLHFGIRIKGILQNPLKFIEII